MDVIFSPHAMGQMQERRLSEETVRDAIEAPDQVVSSGRRRIVDKLLKRDEIAILLRVVLAPIRGR